MNAKMPDLAKAFEAAGFRDARAVLSSGNGLFSAVAAPEAALARKAEAAMKQRLGSAFPTIVRPVEISFERVLSEVKARYLVGLTRRRSAATAIIRSRRCSSDPFAFAWTRRARRRAGPSTTKLIVRETAFRMAADGGDSGIQDIYRALANDHARNDRIVDDVMAAIEEGRSPILRDGFRASSSTLRAAPR
jgi:hypothetical protein